MAPLVVSLAWPVGEERMARLQALSPDLELQDVVALVRGEYRLSRQGESAELQQVRRALDAALARTHVYFGRDLPPDLLQRAPHLRWVQLMSAGVDNHVTPQMLRSHVLFTSGRGIAGYAIAEFVVCWMLMLVKRMPLIMERQRQRVWDRRDVVTSELRDKTLGVVGLGSIGGELARLARAFHMRVLGVRRSATTRQEATDGVDVLYPPAELPEVLRASDFVALCIPLTPETQGLIGEAELRQMRPSAYLINVGRGGLVDEAALARALREGWLAGACLDVVGQEPLPPQSELWTLPNLLISPHTSGNIDRYMDYAMDLFQENLGRYLRGEPLRNVVDPDAVT